MRKTTRSILGTAPPRRGSFVPFARRDAAPAPTHVTLVMDGADTLHMLDEQGAVLDYAQE